MHDGKVLCMRSSLLKFTAVTGNADHSSEK